MRFWALLALALVLAGGLFAYRVASLERRVDALDLRLGPEAEAAEHTESEGGQAAAGYAQRIAALEAEVRALRERLDASPAAVKGTRAAASAASAAASAASEQRILAVVERQQARVRDRQLAFQRSRWLQWRETALDDFAQRFGLSPWQTEQLHQLLSDELDKMVELLRRPDALENPEKGAADWVAMLQQTDDAAHRVLDPAQITAWDQARTAERNVLWPWLPNDK